MDQDTGIDDDEIRILVRHTVARLAWFFLFPVFRFWMVSLSVDIVLPGLFLTRCVAGLCAMGDDAAAAIRVGMGHSQVGLWLTSISPISGCRAASDRLFELFDLMAEKSGAESAGHGKFVGGGCRGRPLGRDKCITVR